MAPSTAHIVAPPTAHFAMEGRMNSNFPGRTAGRIDNQIGRRAKRELIRSIQEMQGEDPCFQSGKNECDRYDCGWRADCMAEGQ